ncbi:hypothetical protein ARAM_003075 [Aspergillus rambellii]|uniref:CFEM domain-containing protein n=1 Tax=Aspergillus rambellii TaxID=308745 RepID=A0A0F8UAB1_9EURO|nr:hypothetical protein ARAM_003075 [Aspergillus rambellii]
MRWSWIVALATLGFIYPAEAGLAELANALPSCALKCFAEVLPQSSCQVTDQVCMCTNQAFTEQIELCVASSCTIRQSLTTKNVTSTACGAPVRDRSTVITVAGLTGGGIALLAFLLRVLARLPCCGGQFGMDDWTMALTMCCMIPLSVLSYPLAKIGLGKDMWTVPFDNITHILYIYFFDECLYLTTIALTKISILCFYLRVFPRREFRIAVYVVIAVNIAYVLVFDLISIFQCDPVRGAWERWDDETDFKCRNINAQGWSAAAINMILDIVVMGLPLRELYQLNLSTRKKAYVMLMFSLGLLVTLVSILRLESLITFSNTQNLTWDYVTVGYWSTIECHVGVICACLPAIRALFRRVWPRIFGDTTLAKSKASLSRSLGTGSRTDGPGLVSSRPKHPDDSFVPLVDMDNASHSSQSHLTGPQNQAYTRTWVEA